MNLRIFVLDKKGQASVEYSLILLLVFLAVVGAASLLGVGLQELYTEIAATLQNLQRMYDDFVHGSACRVEDLQVGMNALFWRLARI